MFLVKRTQPAIAHSVFASQVRFIVLDVHGGTSEQDILDAFQRAEDALTGAQGDDGEGEDEGSEEEAEEKASRGSGDGGDEATSSTTRAEAFLFLDEMNACRHTGLIEEAICSRTLYGKPRAPPTSHLILRLYTLSTTYVHRTKRLVSSV